jgi:hypothetical protein
MYKYLSPQLAMQILYFVRRICLYAGLDMSIQWELCLVEGLMLHAEPSVPLNVTSQISFSRFFAKMLSPAPF